MHLVLVGSTRLVGQTARTTELETENSSSVPSRFSAQFSSPASTSHQVTFIIFRVDKATIWRSNESAVSYTQLLRMWCSPDHRLHVNPRSRALSFKCCCSAISALTTVTVDTQYNVNMHNMRQKKISNNFSYHYKTRFGSVLIFVINGRFLHCVNAT